MQIQWCADVLICTKRHQLTYHYLHTITCIPLFECLIIQQLWAWCKGGPLHTITIAYRYLCIPFCILFKNCMQDRYKRMRCKTDEKNKRMGCRKAKKIKGITNIYLYLCLGNSLSIILYEREKLYRANIL